MKRRPYSLYKKHTKRGVIWYARFWNPAEGRYSKVRSTGVTATGKRGRYYEAHEAAREIQKSISFGAADKTVSEYLADFWQPSGAYALECKIIKKKPLSIAYISSRLAVIEHHVKPYQVFIKMPMCELTPGSIKDWMIWLAQNGRSNQLIEKALSTIRKAIREGVKRGDLWRNAAKYIDPPVFTHKEPGILKPEEVKQLIEAIPDRETRAAVLLGALCGMRQGEIRGLRYEDIQENSVHITNNYQDKEGDKIPKAGSFGVVPLPSFLVDEIGQGTGYIFPNRGKKAAGKPACAGYFRNLFIKATRMIGIGDDERKARNLSFHSLRHTFITNGQHGGVSELMMKALARHKTLNMTRRYTHAAQVLDIEDAREKLKKAQGFEEHAGNTL